MKNAPIIYMYINHQRILLLSFCLTLAMYSAFAKRYYVRENGGGSGEGGWGGAGDLVTILQQAMAGDTIWVRSGTYKPTTNGNRNFSFLLRPGVVMMGGFGGIETSYQARFPDAAPTILSGDIDLAGNADCYHVIRRNPAASPLTAATVLDRFTITGGRADDFSLGIANSNGGGLLLNNESITLIDCIFQQNTSSVFGGAVYANNSSPTFTNCKFMANNSPNAFGGAIYAEGNGTIVLDGCLFKQNTAAASSVIYVEGQIRVNIKSSIFFQNQSSGSSVISLFTNIPSRHQVTNSLFLDNSFSSTESSPTQITSSDSIDIYGSTFVQVPVIGNNIKPIVEIRGNITNSIFWGSSPPVGTPTAVNAINTISQGGLPNCTNCPGGNGNVSPGFVNLNDPDGPDDILGTADDGLRLGAFSPGINAGIRPDVSLLVPANDITGKTRDRQYDIGAYEGAYCTGTTLTRLYVNAASTATNPTGGSWSEALSSLQTAINVATACNTVTEIWVAKGVYKTTDTRDRNRTFSLVNGVAIYGGFAGNETDVALRNPKTNITTLSGDIDNTGQEDAHQIIWNANIGSTAVLDGFTISGARNTANLNGGAIYNTQSSPVFRNCVIMNNTSTGANSSGAGMLNASSSNPLVLNCVFDDNEAISGGAVSNGGGSRPIFRNCVFHNNTATANGGAMASFFATPTLINCTVVRNKAGASGGGVYYNLTLAPVVTNCIFWDNGAVEGKEIGYVVNGASQPPVVSFSYLLAGYTPCSNCTSSSLNPVFLSNTNFMGTDSVWGTLDDQLHLRDGSPARNNGNNAVVTDATDVVGQPRIQNTTVNMGAYENLYFVSLDNGDWNNANNWNYKSIPTLSDPVLIQAGHHIVLKQPNNGCRVLVVNPNARLLINPDGGLRIQ